MAKDLKSLLRTFGGLLLVGSAAAGAAVLAQRFAPQLQLALHAAIFSGFTAFGAVLVAGTLAVFAKLDRLLTDAEKYEAVRVNQLYRYIGRARMQLLFWFLAGLLGPVVSHAVVSVLKDPSVTWHWNAVAVGYAAVAVTLLTAAKVIAAYRRVDGFRREVFNLIEGDQRKAELLRQLRGNRGVSSFEETDAPQFIGTIRRA